MIAALMVAYIASYAFVSAIPDTNRDMFLAQGIVSGRHYPLEGPILGDALHLGPFWYYLLAIPLALTSSWLGATLFVGCLASLKFPLAYLCGKRLIDARFGLLWAMLLALPGWHDYERLTVFNPNPAAAAALALAYVAIRFKASPPSNLALLGCGLLLGIAIHIHPTVAIMGLLPLAATLSHTAKPPALLTRLYQAASFAIGVLIPLVPYAVSQISLGYPDVVTANTYVAQSLAWSSVSKLPLLVWSMFVVGPYIALRHIAQLSGPMLILVGALIGTLHLAAFVGLVRLALHGPRGQKLLAFTLALTAIAFVWVLLLRNNTPAYFTFWLAPVCSGVVALGLRQLPLVRRAGVIVFTLVLLLTIRTAWIVAATMNSGVGALPSSQEIKQVRPSYPYVDVWLPAYAHGAFGELMCSLPTGTALHGPLAHAADWNVNADALLACKRPTAAKLGGDSGRHVMGMPQLFWDRIEATPDCTIGPIGIAKDARVLESTTSEIADGVRYLPRDFNRSAARVERFRFDLAEDEALLITNFLFPYVLSRVESVTMNDTVMTPVATTEMAQIYSAASQRTYATDARLLKWEITISLSGNDGLDIMAVPRRSNVRNDHPDACRP